MIFSSVYIRQRLTTTGDPKEVYMAGAETQGIIEKRKNDVKRVREKKHKRAVGKDKTRKGGLGNG